MFENIASFFKKIFSKNESQENSSKAAAKERLHLVLMQDRANVSADFLDLMRQEIIEVIKKYIDVDEKEIDVRLTNKTNEDGTNGAPALYANIPIVSIKNANKNDISSKENIEKKEVKENKIENSEEKQAEVKEEIEEVNESSDASANDTLEIEEDEKKEAEVNNE